MPLTSVSAFAVRSAKHTRLQLKVAIALDTRTGTTHAQQSGTRFVTVDSFVSRAKYAALNESRRTITTTQNR
jgi:hypothetical protein